FLKSLVAPSSAAVQGVLLASERESRIEREEERTPETLVRRRWEEAVARGEWQRQREQQRRRTEEAARRAQARFSIARALEKRGKFTGALEFYGRIVRESPDTEEGRLSAARITTLRRARELLEGLPPRQ